MWWGFGWGFFFGWGFSLPHPEHPQPWEMWVKALELCGVGFFGAEQPFPEKDLAFQQLGFVLIKLICAFLFAIATLCKSVYIVENVWWKY